MIYSKYDKYIANMCSTISIDFNNYDWYDYIEGKRGIEYVHVHSDYEELSEITKNTTHGIKILKKYMSELVNVFMHSNPDLINHLPNITLFDAAISSDPEYLKNIKNFTPELCEKAIKANPLALQYIPANFKTIELCTIAVEIDGMALQFVDNQSVDICIAAVSNNPKSITYAKYQTDDICSIALNKNSYMFTDILDPSYNICILAIELNPYNLKYINNQTDDMCMYALNINPSVISVIKNQTPAMYKYCGAKRGDLIELVQDKKEEYALIALNTWPPAIKYIINQTESMCMDCVKRDGLMLVYINDNVLTNDIILKALEQNGFAFIYAHPKITDSDFYVYALYVSIYQSKSFNGNGCYDCKPSVEKIISILSSQLGLNNDIIDSIHKLHLNQYKVAR